MTCCAAKGVSLNCWQLSTQPRRVWVQGGTASQGCTEVRSPQTKFIRVAWGRKTKPMRNNLRGKPVSLPPGANQVHRSKREDLCSCLQTTANCEMGVGASQIRQNAQNPRC